MANHEYFASTTMNCSDIHSALAEWISSRFPMLTLLHEGDYFAISYGLDSDVMPFWVNSSNRIDSEDDVVVQSAPEDACVLEFRHSFRNPVMWWVLSEMLLYLNEKFDLINDDLDLSEVRSYATFKDYLDANEMNILMDLCNTQHFMGPISSLSAEWHNVLGTDQDHRFEMDKVGDHFVITYFVGK